MSRILVIDDSLHDRLQAIAELEREIPHIDVVQITCAEDFDQALSVGQFDLVICDYQLSWSDGLSVLQTIKNRYPDCRVVMFTNSGSEEIAVAAMKAGLDDYIIKSPQNYRFLSAAARAALAQKHTTLDHLQTLLNALNIGVYRLREDGVLLAGNRAFLQLLGIEDYAPVTQTLKPNFQLEEYSQFFQLQQEQIGDREVQLRRVDGSTIWVRISQTINTIDGVTVIDGLIEDISLVKQREIERQEALEELAIVEEELKAQNEKLAQQNQDLIAVRQTLERERQRYQELFEFAPDGYLVTDTAATILEANRAAASLLGVQAQFLIGVSFLNFVAEGDRDDLTAKINEPRSGDWVREWEVCVIRQKDLPAIDIVVTVAAVRDRAGQLVALRWLLRDITERKQALTALQASETRFRQLAESIEDVFWMSDPQQARSLYVSPAYEQIWGRSCASLKANWYEWIDAIHPDDRDRVREAFFTNILRGKYDEEYRIVRPDGTVRWVRDRGYPVKNDAGEILCVNGIAEDITQRKYIEAELHRREQEFRALVENSPDIIARFDTELRHLYVNPAVEPATGISRANIIGKTKAELGFATEIVTVWENALREVFAARQCRFFEFEFPSPNGMRAYQSRIAPEFAQDGSVQSLLVISRDITEYKQAEKALRDRSERLKLLSETANTLLSTQQPLTLLNDLFEKLAAQLDLHFYFNFLVEERDDQQVLRLAAYGGISEEVAQAIQWLELGQGMCGMVAQQRRQLLVSDVQASQLPNTEAIRALGITAYSGQPLIVQGRLLGTLCFASRTRTSFAPEEIELMQAASDQVAAAMERAELLASLQQQTEQLTHANRIKDEFLAILSHELRSPLNSILGWAKLLRTRKLNEATTTRALETIERNAELQTQLIEDLLDVSRILRGKLSLNTTVVNLASVVEAAMETMRLAANAKSIQIELRLDSTAGQVSGDATRLQQVIWNLLSNAIKFTPSGGRVSVSLTRNDTYAQIQVSDTGKGISADFLPYVFDYFRQADGSITRTQGGLGLGLAIVRHLVELHGGTITADSPGEGQGATFTLKLPLLPLQSEVSASAPNSDAIALDGARILVVDDEADTREFLTFMLAQYGAEAIAVNSAAAAIERLQSFYPDVVLSDIGMPNEDGYSLIRRIQVLAASQGRQIPAIALTAYAREEDRQAAQSAGFQLHMSKPINPSELVSAIARLIGRG
ncbi:PAS domain S-box protein [Chroococcidiopsis sp. TS-821]|uniref:PAS domain S-box protein n=1 Tax=Chroococcidiopsis sp. TS-821 TaxID=1378066 RepID=UPI000CEDDC09|nr:PAS domain S-box protein [Chroococcidiopsis sp. TS-821]PPS44782.1 hypothetical protein B1A85_00355 [Chroococcidiopsis sp. TS-821]